MRWYLKIGISTAALIVLVLFMDMLVMPWYTRHGDEYELPDITEKSVQEAEQILEENGFIPIVQDSAYDSFLPPGTVLRQNPSPFSIVKKGRRVYLTISSGEKPVVMPNLITETLANANFKLQQEGLAVGDTVWRFADSVEYNGQKYVANRGVVIGQSVPAGDIVTRTQKIVLTVSQGPDSVLPNLVNEGVNRAVKKLKDIGIDPAEIEIEYEYNPDFVPNTVLAQSVPPGTDIRDVMHIVLTVSVDQARLRSLPDLVGKTLNEAKTALRNIGFPMEKLEIRYQYDPQYPPGAVLAQSVTAGRPIYKVRTLELLVNRE